VLLLTGVGHFATHFFELMFPTLAVALARDTGVPLQQVPGRSFLGSLAFGLRALAVGCTFLPVHETPPRAAIAAERAVLIAWRPFTARNGAVRPGPGPRRRSARTRFRLTLTAEVSDRPA